MITRRCTQRQFLMRPDRETNNAFIYCLAVAAQRSRIRVIFTVAMSNHHHTGIEDPEGNYPEFLEHFLPENPTEVDFAATARGARRKSSCRLHAMSCRGALT